ncbi:hypothetical protein [Helicobacter cinaedi]|nr:hypothetical protein [Helicobacter cinaedi]
MQSKVSVKMRNAIDSTFLRGIALETLILAKFYYTNFNHKL